MNAFESMEMMEVSQSIGMLGVMAGQSNTQRDIKELNNTLKQIAAAQGIKIKSIKEIEAEQKYREKFLEARKRGMTVEQYESQESRDSFLGLIKFIAAFIFAFFTGGIIGDYLIGSTCLAWVIGIISFFGYFVINLGLVLLDKSDTAMDVIVIALFLIFFVFALNF